MPQKLYEAASDCICSTLFMCEDSVACYNLAQVLQTEVKKLKPEFKAAVQSEDASRWVGVSLISKPFQRVCVYACVYVQGQFPVSHIYRDGRDFPLPHGSSA